MNTTTTRPSRDPLQALAQRLWPAEFPLLYASDAEWLLDIYHRVQLSDRTSFLLDMKVTKGDDFWSVFGKVNHPRVQSTVIGLLEAAGCTPLQHDIELLPSAKLGDRLYAITQVPMALTWG